eukprot:6649396-Prymnesium_polylepis.2
MVGEWRPGNEEAARARGLGGNGRQFASAGEGRARIASTLVRLPRRVLVHKEEVELHRARRAGGILA